MKYDLYEIDIVEMQTESCPYGDPDQGVPEDALNDFLNLSLKPQEESVCKGEHEFIIWCGEKPGAYFANAWSLPGANKEREFCAYYEFKVGSIYKTINTEKKMDISNMPALHEIFALDQVLATWPDDKSFEEIKKMIVKGSSRVCVAEMFEDWPDEIVIEYLTDLADSTRKFIEFMATRSSLQRQ